jgi:hypothetical protein
MYGTFNLYAFVIVKDCMALYPYSKILVCVIGFDIIHQQRISYPVKKQCDLSHLDLTLFLLQTGLVKNK